MGYFGEKQSGEGYDPTPFVSNVDKRKCANCNKEVYLSFRYTANDYCYRCTNPLSLTMSNSDSHNYECNKKRTSSRNAIYEKGVYFRSKFERDIFLLFDSLGFEIWYEPRRIKGYLADFYLPKHKIWIETRGYPKTDDIRAFKSSISLGIYKGEDFEDVPELIDFIETDLEYYWKYGDDFSIEDIEYYIEQKRAKMEITSLDRYLTLLPMQSEQPGEHNYNINNKCSMLHDAEGQSYPPIIANINGTWEIIDESSYNSKKMNLISAAYYFYFYYNEITKKSNVFLKAVDKNNKICSTKFIKDIP